METASPKVVNESLKMLRGLVGCVIAVKRYPSLKFHMKLSVCHV